MRFDAIVVPQGAEARAVERGWRTSHPPLLRVPAGVAAGRALNDGRPIQTALVLGVCGALDPALRVGQPAVYASIVDGPQTIVLDAELAARCARLLNCVPLVAANVDAVVGDVRAKAALRVATGAAAIDMEAAAIARALHARDVRVVMVRIVSDDAAGDLPDLHDVFDARGSLRPFAFLTACLRAPRRSVRFIVNALRALTALRGIAAQLSR